MVKITQFVWCGSLLLLGLLLCSTASAKKPFSAADLFSQCSKADLDETEVQPDWETATSLRGCLSTIASTVQTAGMYIGVLRNTEPEASSAIFSDSPHLMGNLCIPAGVTYWQMARVVLKYLRENPQEHHMNASPMVLRALHDAFC